MLAILALEARLLFHYSEYRLQSFWVFEGPPTTLRTTAAHHFLLPLTVPPTHWGIIAIMGAASLYFLVLFSLKLRLVIRCRGSSSIK